MTQAQRTTLTGWWDRSKEIVTFAGGLILILGSIYAIIQWSSGGLQLQSQIDLREVRAQLNSIQAAQVDQVKAAEAFQHRIIDRLDALPRPSDYANQEAHLGRLDAAISDLRDTSTGLRHDVDGLTRGLTFRAPSR